MITCIATYVFIGGIVVLPSVDDLSFSQLITTMLSWPIVLAITIYKLIKKFKEL